MRQLEQIFPLWSLLVRLAPVKLGPQMFASSQHLCQKGQLSDTPGPPQVHAAVGWNACTEARRTERRDGIRRAGSTGTGGYLSRLGGERSEAAWRGPRPSPGPPASDSRSHTPVPTPTRRTANRCSRSPSFRCARSLQDKRGASAPVCAGSPSLPL